MVKNSLKQAVVIGAGVSGLVSAHILNNAGYHVTILEKANEAGGRLKKGSFSDGETYETGALWVHDSDHPVAKIFNNGGSYQDYNRNIKTESWLSANFHHYITKPLLQKPYLDHIQNALIMHHKEIKDLSWAQLLEKVADYSQQDSFLIDLRNTFMGTGNIIDQIASYYTELNPQNHDFKNNMIELLLDLGVDINRDAITGSRYYIGSGDGNYIPHEGYSKVINFLLNKLNKQDIEILYNTKAKIIHDEYIITDQGRLIKADITVSAIAPFDYSDIQLQEKDTGSLDVSALYNALDHLRPSGKSKIVLQLTEKINIDHIEYIAIPDTEVFSYISTDGKSDILYILTDNNNMQEYVIDNVLHYLKDNYQKPNLEIKEIKSHYSDGNSWYKQTVGFDPLDNDKKIIYTGVLTGADDSVHSSITAACKALGVVDSNEYLQELFSQSSFYPDFDIFLI